MAIAQRIIAALCAPYSISGQNIVIGASIGIAVIDKQLRRLRRHHALRRHGALPRQERGPQPRLHLRRGDGRRPVAAASCSKATCARRSRTTACELLYQPIVNASGEKVVGVEALCRWTHPTRGDIPPTEFIADRRALRPHHRARRLGAAPRLPRRQGLAGARASRSTSRRCNSAAPISSSMVERILAETEFDPARLELELTESMLLGNVDSAEAAMLRLKALGVRLALDDFGTGYSEPALSAPLPLRQAQDRPQLRAVDRKGRRRRRHRARGGQPRPRPRHEGDRGGRRDRRPAAVPARRRRAFDAGLPLRPRRSAPPRSARACTRPPTSSSTKPTPRGLSLPRQSLSPRAAPRWRAGRFCDMAVGRTNSQGRKRR